MQFRLWYLFAFIALVAAVMSIVFHPSYEKSFEAKYFYYIGEYAKSQKIATEAFELDKYNRMAATIMTQSQVALKFQEYNNNAKKYMFTINEMAKKESISQADRARVKLMCEIMIDSYIKIPTTVVIDKLLLEEAEKYHKNFEKLYEEITTKP